ncbi:winged helix-turn-helix transcriptional regulator [Candidatus Bathyarchaeota archaeon]|nr:winged helix-turn-helix transcriptional regulator [Candidatus Bathyarchaeota archaeon]
MEDLSKYHTLLRDPTRRKIIEILAEQGKVGFKELKQILGLGVGTVYYHLDMLSEFITQDKSRKYMLNDRGRLLYQSMKNGSLPPTLHVKSALSSKIGKWIFLSPIFTKTVKPERILPISILIFILGGVGCAFADLRPFLFLYNFSFGAYEFEKTMIIYLSEWVGLFLYADALAYILYRRVGGELQLFTCLGIASLPLAIFPYITMLVSYQIARYLQIAFQIWSLLLTSAAVSFGKGLRLDKSIIISLTVFYLNIIILVLMGILP